MDNTIVTRTTVSASVRNRPLVVIDDSALLDDVLGIASRAGVEVEVAPDPEAARGRFASAPFVLVGTTCALACARAGVPRRPGVVLVDRDPVDRAETRDLLWRAADAVGAEHVALLPAARPWLEDRFTDTATHGPARLAAMVPGSDAVPAARDPSARVVAVLGGRGGAGASVLAAGLAVTGARAGLRALLIDADPLGGGADLVLGWEALDGLRWPALSQTSGAVNPPAFVGALPSRGDLAVLSWDRGRSLTVPAPAMATAVEAGRQSRELVVIDLPRTLDDASILALDFADLALLVVPAELRACAAAAKVVEAAGARAAGFAVVVRLPAPGRLRAKEISRALGLPVFGTLRPEPALARGLEHGEPPGGNGRGPLAALCCRVLESLGLSDRPAA